MCLKVLLTSKLGAGHQPSLGLDDSSDCRWILKKCSPNSIFDAIEFVLDLVIAAPSWMIASKKSAGRYIAFEFS
jgi:hypothetical protein